MPLRVGLSYGAKWRSEDVKRESDISFKSFLLSDKVTKGLRHAGFKKPSPIQLKAIPIGRCGMDLIMQSKSGTGKTCVFTVVALESLTDSPALQVLVMAPTREIAHQNYTVLKAIGQDFPNLQAHVFIGGTPVEDDVRKLKNCQVALGTPGRIRHLMEMQALLPESVKLLVLDEADQLIDETFMEDINWIFNRLPLHKQVLAASATFPEPLKELMENYMRFPKIVSVSENELALKGIIQFYTVVEDHPMSHIMFNRKKDVLREIFSSISFAQCIIFCNWITRVEMLYKWLKEEGYPVAKISSNDNQAGRLNTLDQLKSFKCKIVVSSNLTARGIDAENVDLVINFDLAKQMDTYLHRIGRSGRFGAKAICITIVSAGYEEQKLSIFERGGNFDVYLLPDPIPEDLYSWAPDTPKLRNIKTCKDIVSMPEVEKGDSAGSDTETANVARGRDSSDSEDEEGLEATEEEEPLASGDTQTSDDENCNLVHSPEVKEDLEPLTHEAIEIVNNRAPVKDIDVGSLMTANINLMTTEIEPLENKLPCCGEQVCGELAAVASNDINDNPTSVSESHYCSEEIDNQTDSSTALPKALEERENSNGQLGVNGEESSDLDFSHCEENINAFLMCHSVTDQALSDNKCADEEAISKSFSVFFENFEYSCEGKTFDQISEDLLNKGNQLLFEEVKTVDQESNKVEWAMLEQYLYQQKKGFDTIVSETAKSRQKFVYNASGDHVNELKENPDKITKAVAQTENCKSANSSSCQDSHSLMPNTVNKADEGSAKTIGDVQELGKYTGAKLTDSKKENATESSTEKFHPVSVQKKNYQPKKIASNVHRSPKHDNFPKISESPKEVKTFTRSTVNAHCVNGKFVADKPDHKVRPHVHVVADTKTSNRSEMPSQASGNSYGFKKDTQSKSVKDNLAAAKKSTSKSFKKNYGRSHGYTERENREVGDYSRAQNRRASAQLGHDTHSSHIKHQKYSGTRNHLKYSSHPHHPSRKNEHSSMQPSDFYPSAVPWRWPSFSWNFHAPYPSSYPHNSFLRTVCYGCGSHISPHSCNLHVFCCECAHPTALAGPEKYDVFFQHRDYDPGRIVFDRFIRSARAKSYKKSSYRA